MSKRKSQPQTNLFACSESGFGRVTSRVAFSRFDGARQAKKDKKEQEELERPPGFKFRVLRVFRGLGV